MDDLRPQPGSNIDKKIEALKTVDLLVLDDLGAQRNTEWVTERIFVKIQQPLADNNHKQFIPGRTRKSA